MFGFFKRKKEEKQRLQRAYEMGQDTAEKMSDAIEAFLQHRYAPIRERTLEALKDQLQTALSDRKMPALTSAGLYVKAFNNHVDKMVNQKMREEAEVALFDWFDLAREVELESEFSALMQDRFSDFGNNLRIAGIELLEQYIVPLEHADDAWRSTHPEHAEKLDEYMARRDQ